MKSKTLTIIVVSILLIGIVTAAGTIINISESLEIIPSTFIAGSTTTAEFSFDYPDISETYPNQEDYAPLMIKVNISSLEENYPVWKNDFELDGSLLNKRWWILPDTLYYFDCYEDDFTYYYNQQPQEITNIPDGTFYCFNPGFSAMRIDSSNDVVLNILSDPALYPGEYNISVGLYYPQEEYINIEVTPIVYHAPEGENSSVEFNMSFEISGGDAIRMKMSDLFEGYVSDGISFTIGGANYTVEELNARLVYDGINYSVGNEYENWTKEGGGDEPIIFDIGIDGIARGTAVFMMDIKDYMAPGNYHGTYQFDVTQEN